MIEDRLAASINIKGELVSLHKPLIMGILNTTPDSFYSGSRKENIQEIIDRAGQIISKGGDIIDVGGYSSRPGADDISVKEELSRVIPAIKAIKDNYPDARISVDTFRSEVAAKALESGAGIINDISGGKIDQSIYDVAIQFQATYIGMHMKGNPQIMQKDPHYSDIMEELIFYFSEMIQDLKSKGLNDLIIDPGFGFGKTIEHNYSILNNLDRLQLFNLPILVGLSRKSMIYKVLNSSPEESLNGTTALNMIALQKGASILRVHDVREAVECVRLIGELGVRSEWVMVWGR